MSKLSTINYQSKIPRVLFIVGPTASGKSSLAIRVARELGGEIICADSQTLRRHLNIGTAKPSVQEQTEIPHHMLDVIEPYERFSVAQFKKQAESIIKDCQKRSVLPIVVGGTGLYIDSLYYDYSLPLTKSSERVELEKLSVEQLQAIITQKGYEMPENAANSRHLVGVIARKGQSPQDRKLRKGSVIVGLTRDDESLKKRIAQRIDGMLQAGLIDEISAVSAKFGQPPSKLDAICYPIFYRYISGEIDLIKAKDLFARADWQYARRQRAWFKRNPNIEWFTDEETAYRSLEKQLATA